MVSCSCNHIGVQAVHPCMDDLCSMVGPKTAKIHTMAWLKATIAWLSLWTSSTTVYRIATNSLASLLQPIFYVVPRPTSIALEADACTYCFIAHYIEIFIWTLYHLIINAQWYYYMVLCLLLLVFGQFYSFYNEVYHDFDARVDTWSLCYNMVWEVVQSGDLLSVLQFYINWIYTYIEYHKICCRG